MLKVVTCFLSWRVWASYKTILCSTDTVTISFLSGTSMHWVRLCSLASSFDSTGSKGTGWVYTQAAVATSQIFRTPNTNTNYLSATTLDQLKWHVGTTRLFFSSNLFCSLKTCTVKTPQQAWSVLLIHDCQINSGEHSASMSSCQDFCHTNYNTHPKNNSNSPSSASKSSSNTQNTHLCCQPWESAALVSSHPAERSLLFQVTRQQLPRSARIDQTSAELRGLVPHFSRQLSNSPSVLTSTHTTLHCLWKELKPWLQTIKDLKRIKKKINFTS